MSVADGCEKCCQLMFAVLAYSYGSNKIIFMYLFQKIVTTLFEIYHNHGIYECKVMGTNDYL